MPSRALARKFAAGIISQREQDERQQMISVLTFYRDAWEQDVDAEQTATGWEGSVRDPEPSAELLADKGEKARQILDGIVGAGPVSGATSACSLEQRARELLAQELDAAHFRQSAKMLRAGLTNDLTAPALRAMLTFRFSAEPT